MVTYPLTYVKVLKGATTNIWYEKFSVGSQSSVNWISLCAWNLDLNATHFFQAKILVRRFCELNYLDAQVFLFCFVSLFLAEIPSESRDCLFKKGRSRVSLVIAEVENLEHILQSSSLYRSALWMQPKNNWFRVIFCMNYLDSVDMLRYI